MIDRVSHAVYNQNIMKQKGNLAELVTKGFLETKLDELREEIDENARKYRDEILTGLDKVMGELQTIRDENTILGQRTVELRDQMDNYGKRITRLEEVKVVT